MSKHGNNPATARTPWSAMRRSAAVWVLAFITAGCVFGSDNPAIEGDAERGFEEVLVPAEGPILPGLLDPGDSRLFSACRLLEEIRSRSQDLLGVSFESHGESRIPGRNDCTLKKPLTKDYDEYRLNLIIWTPLEGEFLEAQWEANPQWERPVTKQGAEWKAIFEEGNSQQPTTVGLGNGLVHVGAHANYHFQTVEELGGIWMTLQKGGTLAADYDPDELDLRFENLAYALQKYLAEVAGLS